MPEASLKPTRAPRSAGRNRSVEPAVAIIVTTARIGRFFRELDKPVGTTAWPPTPEAIQQFLDTAERYGYWNATPEENAAVGLHLA